MTRSREYALERLDKWYADKFRINYTEDIAAKMREQLFESAKNKDDNIRNEVARFAPLLSRENQIEIAEKYFSLSYASTEKLIEDLVNYKELPNGVKEEYVNPLIKQFDRFKGFVEGVRQVSCQNLEREVTDNEINQVFINSFGGHEGFTDFMLKYMQALSYILDLDSRKGKISNSEFKEIEDFLEIARPPIKYAHEILFGSQKR